MEFLKAVLSKPGRQKKYKEKALSSGRSGSVGWVPSCKPEGHQFDYQLGHMPGLRVRYLGVHVEGS